MIWRLLICFSLLGIGPATPLLLAATVRGQIVLKDPNHSHSKKVDAAGVVVWLDALSPDTSLPKPNPVRVEMVQKNKTFTPHVLAIPVGSTIDFPNDDPIFHNAFSSYNGQIFDIGLYPPGSSRSVKFRRPGVVRVFCNIHSFMSAVIVVLRSPFYTTTGDDGSFKIANVPKGNYRLEFYYERATEQELATLSRTVEVTGEASDVGSVVISEAGYLPMPHLNKFGKPYPDHQDPETYPGSRP